MVFAQSILKVADNSGGILVNLIKVLNKSTKKAGIIGSYITLSIRSCLFGKKVEKGLIYKGLIIRTKKYYKRYNGSYVMFSTNSAILLDDKLNPLSNRVKGPILQELTLYNYSKYLNIFNFIF